MALKEQFLKETMTTDDQTLCHKQVRVSRWQNESTVDALDLIGEEIPVAMIYNGISHVVMMVSPANLEDFALGFSLSEGIVQSEHEIYDIQSHRTSDSLYTGLELHIKIASQRAAELKEHRRNLTGRTGCGLCGAESLQQALRPANRVNIKALPNNQSIDLAVQNLSSHQTMQALSGAFHAAAWCDMKGEIKLIREDVGRHNALDKLIGALQPDSGLCFNRDQSDGFILVSSRASYEMVQKASQTGVSTLVTVSAATGLALDLAEKSGLNLISFARSGRHTIYHQSNKTTD